MLSLTPPESAKVKLKPLLLLSRSTQFDGREIEVIDGLPD
jgi:hypothetical protein